MAKLLAASHPVAFVISDSVKECRSRLSQDAVADLVAKATGLDRKLVVWVEVNGVPELWLMGLG